MKYVSIENLSVSYGPQEVLSDVYLNIYSDDFLGVIGPNGGGKTSLIKAMLGIVPYTGTITMAHGISENGRRMIGYLPQTREFDMMFPISVIDVVLSGLQKRGRRTGYDRSDKKTALDLLDRMGVAAIAYKPIGEISGGQMQRALLCRALISNPKLLILDEPANFVDNKFEKELYTILQELNSDMAIVMVSHDVGMISSVVKNIVCVNRYVHRHESNLITAEQLDNYDCPVQLVTHGHIPHTVLTSHEKL